MINKLKIETYWTFTNINKYLIYKKLNAGQKLKQKLSFTIWWKIRFMREKQYLSVEYKYIRQPNF